jgi:FtsP/CotA-like multicopper oxidase with cupredoxin domain
MALGVLAFTSSLLAQQNTISDAPEVRDPFTLTAQYDAEAGRNVFSYRAGTVPPTIRVAPGSTINVRYVNHLPKRSREQCATGPCTDASNLHFHGLHVSPQRPQDDVLTMMSMPGQELNYEVHVPSHASPGLYWYHTHPHGESARQDLDGMSGAIVVEGIDRYYPELRGMKERVLILRELDFGEMSDQDRKQIEQRVSIPVGRCGTATEQKIERVFTLNGKVRPGIPISPGEQQFWRIVNASPDRYADLQIGENQLEIVALDGMPLSYHDPSRHTRRVDHILVAPAARVEAIVTGPPIGKGATLSTRCIDTGPDGDSGPAMVIADVVSEVSPHSSGHVVPTTLGQPIYKEISAKQLQKVESRGPDFTVIFTEDKNGFYINGKRFSMDSGPMLRVRTGSMQHWRVINATRELHPFHIHQVHFLAYAVNGVQSDTPEWLDTVNVPYSGMVDIVMDFTDPVIRGMSLFHCHLLNHEDKGMMAKVLFQ